MKRVFNRFIAIFPAILLQLTFWIVMFIWFRPFIPLIFWILSLGSVVFILYTILQPTESAYKIAWIIIMCIAPMFGAWLYLYFGNKRSLKPITNRIKKGNRRFSYKYTTDESVIKYFNENDRRLYQSIKEISDFTSYPIVFNQSAKYYSLGEEMFEDMIKDLLNAKKFIFLEYFIISDGYFLDTLTTILKNKVLEGVDVRILYDDLGSISTYSLDNVKDLRKHGIQVTAFNPLIFVKSTLNNRDHRKMLIIDNEIAYSGGINIADEYINKKERFGHWKDTGFRVIGDAVNTFTYMFIEFWNAYSTKRLNNTFLKESLTNKDYKDGIIFSYYDSPANEKQISNNLIIDLLYQAQDYAWVYTPYLILGENLMQAFINAAKRGVDVRIIVPGIPDKKIVYRMTRSYYAPLNAAGVKIYEYTPGFLHAKSLLIDDDKGTIGTVNLDYRSLFLHFENNSFFYKSKILNDLKNDFIDTMQKSKEIKTKDIKKKFRNRLVDGILRLFATIC